MSYSNMFSQPVVFVDIETTGVTPRSSRVLEVAALRVENGTVTRQLSTVVDPAMPIPSIITSITGLTDEDTKTAPSFYDISDELLDVFRDAVFVAHNVMFDYSFLRAEFAQLGIRFKPELLCTVRLSRALYPNARGHSLEKIIKRHSITVASRHRALDDTQAILDFARLAYDEHGEAAFTRAVEKQLPQGRLL